MLDHSLFYPYAPLLLYEGLIGISQVTKDWKDWHALLTQGRFLFKQKMVSEFIKRGKEYI